MYYICKERKIRIKRKPAIEPRTPGVCSSVPPVHPAARRAELAVCAPALPNAAHNRAATQTAGTGRLRTPSNSHPRDQRRVPFADPRPPDAVRGPFPGGGRSSRPVWVPRSRLPSWSSARYLPFVVAALTLSLFSSARALLCCLTVLTARLKVLSIIHLWCY